jgi:serine protease Do
MTNEERELLDQLHAYLQGRLSEDERSALEERMRTDGNAREYLKVVSTLQMTADRQKLKVVLDSVHAELPTPAYTKTFRLPWANKNVKLWPAIAVAASVVLLSIAGTFLMTQSVEEKRNAEFRDLRRKMEQISKSQKELMEDIAVKKEKEEVPSAIYAGTGFLISANGFLITSSHVVRGADSVFVENQKFGMLKAEVVSSDATNDIAVLRIIQPFPSVSLPFTIRKAEEQLGEQVFTLGFPREDIVYGEGTISAMTGFKQNLSSYQIAVPVNPGNSGGPLLNHHGDVIGMITGVQTETTATAFAVKSSVLLDAIANVPLDSLRKPPVLPGQNKIRSLTRVQQIRKLQDYVFVVKVYNNH